MTARRKASETLRIDLLPESGNEPVSRINRVGWSNSPKVPEYVAESRYRELLEGLYDGALVARFSGRLIDANARAVEFLQYEGWELNQLTIFDIVSGVDEGLLDQLVHNLEHERFSLIQAYCMRKDDTYFPAEISVSRLRLDGPCLCFFIRDISLRMEAEDRLRVEHEALLIAGNGIGITDCTGRVQFVNPALGRMLGIADPESLVESDIRDIIADHELAESLLVSVIRESAPVSVDVELSRPDGGLNRCHITASCKRSDEGDPLGFVFAFADISHLDQ